MRWPQSRLAIIVMLLASALVMAGCSSVPTSGPIEEVEGQQTRGCPSCVNVEVLPPAPDDKPRQIVEGFLRATSYYQPNYTVARQFLTPMAAEKWSPDTGVTIYRAPVKPVGKNRVKLQGTIIGSMDKDRTYNVRNDVLDYDFTLSDENGHWRINNPPPGLWVSEVSFKFFYQSYDLYFVGNNRSLVPDPIYLPALSNPANVASALIKALLNGPSEWLKPAVSTTIPPNTSLSVDSVTITDGIAEVALGESILALPDAQRGLLAAQIAFTLKQVAGVKGVVIKVNQQPYRVPGADPNSQVTSVDAIPRELDPIPSVAGEQAYAVNKKGAVEQVTPSADSPTSNPVPGPLRQTSYPINAVAVSVTNTDLAVTTNARTTLRRAAMMPGGSAKDLLTGTTELLRPQFSRYGEIWEVGKQGGQQRMWMFTPDNAKHEITLPAQNITAFRISPDGSRMALVRRTANGSELGLARIIRSDQPRVETWRRLDTSQSGTSISEITDVAWFDPTELLVLGKAGGNSTLFRVAQDASLVTQKGEAQDFDAKELAVSPQTQSVIMVGSRGGTWKDDGTRWQPFLNHKISAIAYPG